VATTSQDMGSVGSAVSKQSVIASNASQHLLHEACRLNNNML
jgi:hypothetical protein